jgi:hypothetical protein
MQDAGPPCRRNAGSYPQGQRRLLAREAGKHAAQRPPTDSDEYGNVAGFMRAAPLLA